VDLRWINRHTISLAALRVMVMARIREHFTRFMAMCMSRRRKGAEICHIGMDQFSLDNYTRNH